MSTYLGTTLLAGVSTNTKYNAHDLLDWKWTDHQINDQSWVLASTNSWNDGTVYTEAYDLLVAEYNAGTSSSEFVNGTYIEFKLSASGRKITTDSTTVNNIYNANGVAWYYVIDTANTRFKLPRENPDREKLIQIIKAKGDGGSLGLTNDTDNFGVMTYDTSGKLFVRTGAYGQEAGASSNSGTYPAQYTAIGLTYDEENSGIVADMTEATSVFKGKKYLYFYVGQFSQSATEQTAGLNSELFNAKVDLDGGNATFPHVTSMYEEDGILVVLWSNNYCEQSGFVNTTATTTTVNLKKEYTNTNYNISLTEKYTANAYPANVHTVNTGSFVVYVPTVNQDFYWKTCGFIA